MMSSDDSNLTWRRWRCFCSNSSFCSSNLLKLNMIFKQIICTVHKMINSLNSDCCVFCLQAISSDDLRVAASQHCSFPRNCSSREYCSNGQFVSPIPAPYYCSSYHRATIPAAVCQKGFMQERKPDCRIRCTAHCYHCIKNLWSVKQFIGPSDWPWLWLL